MSFRVKQNIQMLRHAWVQDAVSQWKNHFVNETSDVPDNILQHDVINERIHERMIHYHKSQETSGVRSHGISNC